MVAHDPKGIFEVRGFVGGAVLYAAFLGWNVRPLGIARWVQVTGTASVGLAYSIADQSPHFEPSAWIVENFRQSLQHRHLPTTAPLPLSYNNTKLTFLCVDLESMSILTGK